MPTTQSFGATSGFGTFTAWGLQGGDNPSTASERANALDENGNEVASNVTNPVTSYSANYTCNNDTNTPCAVIGKLYGSAIVTSIAIATSNAGPATMTLQGHNHGTNAHTDTLKQVAHGITVAKAFGATDFLGGTGGTSAAVVSGNITITCSHEDITDDDNEEIDGQNYLGQMVATTVWSGTVTTTAGAGWDVTSNVVTTTNQGWKTTTITATKALTLAAPA